MLHLVYARCVALSLRTRPWENVATPMMLKCAGQSDVSSTKIKRHLFRGSDSRDCEAKRNKKKTDASFFSKFVNRRDYDLSEHHTRLALCRECILHCPFQRSSLFKTIPNLPILFFLSGKVSLDGGQDCQCLSNFVSKVEISRCIIERWRFRPISLKNHMTTRERFTVVFNGRVIRRRT